MLLHRLPAESLDSSLVSFARPRAAFILCPKLKFWEWLLPIATAEACLVTAFPVWLLAQSAMPHPQIRIAAAAAGSLLLWIFSVESQKLALAASLPGYLGFSLASATSCLIWLTGLQALLFAAYPDLPRLKSTATGIATALSLFALRSIWRIAMRKALERGSCLERAIVLAATEDEARDAARQVEAATGGRTRAVATSALPGTAGAPSMAWVEDAVAEGIADRILIGGFEHFSATLERILPQLAPLDVDVTMLGATTGMKPHRFVQSRIGPLPAVQIAAPPLTPWQCRTKRAADITIASLALLLTAPLLLAIAACVALESPGPVLFRQRRIGFRGNTFEVIKFRTMYCHLADHEARQQTERNDPRVTRLGRVLRRLSIDELPQLLNVLRGDMSIVGPRPHALGMTVRGRRLEEVIDVYQVRHRVRPGVTGWAQVNGCRGEVDCDAKLQERLALDCDYIDRWSLALDLWIMARTVAIVFFDRRAY